MEGTARSATTKRCSPSTPNFSYRYAFFSGGETSSGKSENFDPLFYSGPNWGTWTQGEIVGEWVL